MSVGDLVAGGLFAPAGTALADLGAKPALVLIDVPGGGGSSAAAARAMHAVRSAAGLVSCLVLRPGREVAGRGMMAGCRPQPWD